MSDEHANCRYYSEVGLIIYDYPTSNPPTEDADECTLYTKTKRNCSNEQPCRQCVRHQNGYCSYPRADGCVKRHITRFYKFEQAEFAENEEVVLDEAAIAKDKERWQRTAQNWKGGSSKKDSKKEDSNSDDSSEAYNAGDADLDSDLDNGADLYKSEGKKQDSAKSALIVALAMVAANPRTYGEAMATDNADEWHKSFEDEY